MAHSFENITAVRVPPGVLKVADGTYASRRLDDRLGLLSAEFLSDNGREGVTKR